LTVQHLLPGLPPQTLRILHRAWPGPVAFQLRLTEPQRQSLLTSLGDVAEECLADSFLTLRCPDNPTTLEIFARAKVPIAVVAASANPSPYELSDIPEPVRSSVDALLDGGPTRYRKSSTLARIDAGRLSVIRQGVIDERIIQRMADLVILFVCSGNTCRSPMAMAIAQGILAKRLNIPVSELPARHILVQSAGVHAASGMRATREAVAALRERHLDLGTHISQPASLDLLRRADFIFTMTDAHREEILDQLPGSAGKVQRLDPAGDIDDPIGAGEAVYRQVADHLQEVIQKRMDELVL
jgi:protein-tyrosine phosphatase